MVLFIVYRYNTTNTTWLLIFSFLYSCACFILLGLCALYRDCFSLCAVLLCSAICGCGPVFSRCPVFPLSCVYNMPNFTTLYGEVHQNAVLAFATTLVAKNCRSCRYFRKFSPTLTTLIFDVSDNCT
jgi:hypothetical protein